MSFNHEEIKDIFIKLGKEEFGIWFSGKKNEGEYMSWHYNGELLEHSFYKDNELDKEQKAWYSNGELHWKCFFKDGKINGEFKSWHSDGSIRENAIYKNGKLIKRIK